jgi:hypothetical protein
MGIKLTTDTLIGIGVAATIVLLVIILIYYILVVNKHHKKPLKKKRVVQKKVAPEKIDTSFEGLRKIIKKQTSTTDELSDALALILKKYGDISKQDATSGGTCFDSYIDVLFMLCRHPNTNKDIIIKFDSALAKKNPKYSLSIHDTVTHALDTRG